MDDLPCVLIGENALAELTERDWNVVLDLLRGYGIDRQESVLINGRPVKRVYLDTEGLERGKDYYLIINGYAGEVEAAELAPASREEVKLS